MARLERLEIGLSLGGAVRISEDFFFTFVLGV